jgi:hypothetical protein
MNYTLILFSPMGLYLLYHPTDIYARLVSIAAAISMSANANAKKAKLYAECAREVVMRQEIATSEDASKGVVACDYV